jgi:hypothetical protein
MGRVKVQGGSPYYGNSCLVFLLPGRITHAPNSSTKRRGDCTWYCVLKYTSNIENAAPTFYLLRPWPNVTQTAGVFMLVGACEVR